MSDNVKIKDSDGIELLVSSELITLLNGLSVSAQKAQRIIMSMRDADGSALDVTTTTPMPVIVQDMTMTFESGDDAMAVGGDADLFVPTITLDTAAYTAGDVLSGRITLANATKTKKTGVLLSILVRFVGSLTPALDFWFFDQQPAQTTGNNSPFNWNASDDGHLIWRVGIENASTDPQGVGHYVSVPGATPRSYALVSLPAPIIKSVANDIGLIITTRTPFTAAAATDMATKIGIGRD